MWAAFLQDPEWQRVQQDSIADGWLVQKVDSIFLTAADFSAIQ